MVKEKENNVLTLVRAGGDALDVELLHDDKQDGDGDGHQHTACTEERKVIVDQGLLQHIIQTRIGLDMGRTTWKNTQASDAPSSLAASRREMGMVSKKPLQIR